MLNEGLSGVEFCVLNTDVQALSASPVPNQLAIGLEDHQRAGRRFGSRGGRQAALEDTEKIIDLLEGADMVFVTAGWAAEPERAPRPWWLRSPKNWAR